MYLRCKQNPSAKYIVIKGGKKGYPEQCYVNDVLAFAQVLRHLNLTQAPEKRKKAICMHVF